jgi:hypothetical protein
MTYSYTQLSQYLGCPRRYRHRYLDGWQEKDTRAAGLGILEVHRLRLFSLRAQPGRSGRFKFLIDP